MKKNLLLTGIALCFGIKVFSQNTFPASGSAGIGTTTPNASALLEITSTSKGLLVPRMTKTQRDAILSPATGLLIYQTNNTAGFYYFNGSSWTPGKIAAGANKNLGNLTAPTAVNISLLPAINNTVDLGNASNGWKDNYLTGSLFMDGTSFLTNGNSNVFVGDNSGASVTGSENTGTGFNTLKNTTSATYNTASGSNSMFSNLTGGSNCAYGAYSLYTNSSGSNNVAMGLNAMYFNTSGAKNVAIGFAALQNNTTGANNIAIGYNSGDHNTIGSNNTSIGYFAMDQNQTGNNNVAYGNQALSKNISGNSNVALGAASLYKNTTRGNLVAIGDSALYNNGTGAVNSFEATNNTAIGSKSLYANTIGTNNTAMGFNSMLNNTSGNENTAFGKEALTGNLNGNSNTAVGFQALNGTTAGSNTAIGMQALSTNVTGTGNTAIGQGTAVSATNLSNATAIGSLATVNASNKMQLGSSTSTLATTGGITIVSDGRFKDDVRTDDVPGLDFISKLRPVTYNFNYKRYDDFLRKDIRGIETGEEYQNELMEKGKTREVGFIAQEINETVNRDHFTYNGVYTPQNENDNYAVDYSRLVVPLVKSVQELSAQNLELKNALQKMQKQIDALSGIEQKSSSELKSTETKIKITPNPARSMTTITISSDEITQNSIVKIVDASGRILRTMDLENGLDSFELNTSGFGAGTYMVQLYSNNTLVKSEKLIVQ